MRRQIIGWGLIVFLGGAFFSCESLKAAMDSAGKSLSDAASGISSGVGSGSGLACRILVGKLEGRRPLGTPRRR